MTEQEEKELSNLLKKAVYDEETRKAFHLIEFISSQHIETMKMIVGTDLPFKIQMTPDFEHENYKKYSDIMTYLHKKSQIKS
ncbi:hypothetical protein DFR65_11226 [Oceanihabitans sediminis]|uniref:Uncharacterized protein n=1 Tax=Oceanihabitans sediminis TaxID=1812012 RepID=A0A368P0P9_9FLAO|nr:hypothetical protein [Oceanihabitans sediminis]RBP27048.1 hypothetical protein DFR65_11226 [Oceanihabitans sediminis]RCU56402.1 hypothetical protein DU428_13145 [Oceanihabitans sediminis]